MQAESYLPKEAQKIFERIHEHVKTNGLDLKIDSLEMSMLAFSFYQFAEAVKSGIEKGFLNEYENEKGSTIQINGYQAQINQCYSNILKHSPKFGLTPGDREKITAFAKKEVQEKSGFDQLRGSGKLKVS